MCLRTQQHYVLKVSVVDVRIYTEQTFENYLYDIQKVLRERYSQGAWENFLVIKLVLHPGH